MTTHAIMVGTNGYRFARFVFARIMPRLERPSVLVAVDRLSRSAGH